MAQHVRALADKDLGDLADEGIEGTFSYHDRHQFEVKLDYTVDPRRRKNDYCVEVYFFIPRAMHINAETYSRAHFYQDIQGYIRFKTPHIGLEKLIDDENGYSPLNRLKDPLAKLRAGHPDRGLSRGVINEMKMFSCIFRSMVRNYCALLLNELDQRGDLSPGQVRSFEFDVVPASEKFLDDMERCLDAFRDLRSDLLAPPVPDSVRHAYEYVNEMLSISVSEGLNELLSGLEAFSEESTSGERLVQRVRELVITEDSYRRDTGYASVIVPDDPSKNESYRYRRGVLKKFCSNILFLRTNTREVAKGTREMLLAFAAGIAMVVATGISIWASTKYRLNSLPFLVIVVMGYMLKDRTKEWLRGYFAKGLSRWLVDHKLSIVDPGTGETIGVCGETFAFIPFQSVPPEVKRVRNMDRLTTIEHEGKPEEIIRYEKTVQLNGRKIMAIQNRRSDINDIVRFNISAFLTRLDDPYTKVLYLEPKSGQQKRVTCAKVYHLNVVFRFRTHDEKGNANYTHNRIRIILDKTGIRRIERTV